MVKKYNDIFSEEEKQLMKEDYLQGASIREIAEKYGIKSKDWIRKTALKGVVRNISEAGKLAHEKMPQSFKHSEETKDKIRQCRLKYMKEHPENTAWRKRNEPSYPEKCFIEFLEANGYDKKFLIEREYPVFPFYIDFAFVNEKVAVEIDGGQHVRDEERIERDKEKNHTLLSNGWKVLRITENLVKTNWGEVKKALDETIGTVTVQLFKVGIFHTQGKKYQKKPRGEDGLTDAMRSGFFKQRKVKNRPSYEELKKMLDEIPRTKVAEMYGVSEAAIRKWLKLCKKKAHDADN